MKARSVKGMIPSVFFAAFARPQKSFKPHYCHRVRIGDDHQQFNQGERKPLMTDSPANRIFF